MSNFITLTNDCTLLELAINTSHITVIRASPINHDRAEITCGMNQYYVTESYNEVLGKIKND